MSTQNDTEHMQDLILRDIITADEANIEMVRINRFRIVKGSLPRDVRKALNGAVKRGYLGHMKKDGNKPECYHHPSFDYLAREARAREARKKVNALAQVCK